jgi:hypothetical protein
MRLNNRAGTIKAELGLGRRAESCLYSITVESTKPASRPVTRLRPCFPDPFLFIQVYYPYATIWL